MIITDGVFGVLSDTITMCFNARASCNMIIILNIIVMHSHIIMVVMKK